MMDDDAKQVAEQLVAATRQGEMGKAYGILARIPFKAMPAVALGAGFSCISTRNRNAFVTDLQHQVAEACRRRTDGFGLRPEQA